MDMKRALEEHLQQYLSVPLPGNWKAMSAPWQVCVCVCACVDVCVCARAHVRAYVAAQFLLTNSMC